MFVFFAGNRPTYGVNKLIFPEDLMRRLLHFIIVWSTAALFACSGQLGSVGDNRPAENCQSVGDEDGNGRADCSDPACAGLAACQPVCGNGILEQGEACDDGDRNGDGARCNASCTFNVCGDGQTLAGVEQCDGGAGGRAQDTLACDSDCTLSVCGDGHLNTLAGEGCDHGRNNGQPGDPCSLTCQDVNCGNGSLEQGEECDDGASNGRGARCNASCRFNVCGDADARAGVEQCDDGLSGHRQDSARCDDDCTFAVCGDGHLNTLAGEICDDGASNGRPDDPCSSACRLVRCGNGMVEQGEQCDDGNSSNGDGCSAACRLEFCGNGTVDPGEECDDGNARDADGCENSCTASALVYFKPHRVGLDEGFGVPLAMSADGSILVVAASREDSAASGVDADPTGFANDAGAVYVFEHTGASWRQQAYIKASNTGAEDRFGSSVALSADGSVLAIGAPLERSAATGVGGNQADDSAFGAGAVYVFTRSGAHWSQQAYIKASNTAVDDNFGGSVALSADGSILAVGAVGESSAATGIGGDQADNSAQSAGAVYVFTRTGATWSQQAYVKASNTDRNDMFGWSVALSEDGSTMAASAIGESSAATGIDGDQASNLAPLSGAVYVFTRSGAAWTQQTYVKTSNTGAEDECGVDVALSADGSTLVVGCPDEDSAATGVDGDQADNSASFAGAAYVFVRSGATWTQQAYLKASNTDAGDRFGFRPVLSSDGSTLAVSAIFESSAATGIGGDQGDNSKGFAGAAYVFKRTGATWTQRSYVKASNTDGFDIFGGGVALSADGSILAVGAAGEDSVATGIGGDQSDNTATSTGAVYLYSSLP